MRFQTFESLPASHPRTLLHLLTCGACRDAAVTELLPADPPPANLGSHPQAPASASADRATLDPDALGAHPAAPAPETLRLERLVDALERLPADRLGAVWRGRRVLSAEVQAALLERGSRLLRAEPRRSERLGLLGLYVAGRLAETQASPQGLARAATLVGAARRQQGRRKEARRAFEQAGRAAEGGIEEATYFRELGLLHWQEGRTLDAATLLACAAEKFGEALEGDAEAVCQALLGQLRWEGGDSRASAPLRLALRNLDPARQPFLALKTWLALAHLEASEGRLGQGWALLDAARPLAGEVQRLDAARQPALVFLWTEARLYRLENKLGPAGERLQEVCAAKRDQGHLGEAALASLDLALVGYQQGDPTLGESLADELAFRFRKRPGLVLALQALAELDEGFAESGLTPEAAFAAACDSLRKGFRAAGLALSPPPFP